MIYFAVFLISILLAVGQLTFFSKLAFWAFNPNLILAGILSYAIFGQEEKNQWFVLIPALILDLLVGRPFGFLTLALWLTFYLIDWLARILFRQNDWPAIVLLIMSGVLFFELSLVGLIKLAGLLHLINKINFEWFYFYGTIPLNILGNGIFCLFFVRLLQKIISKKLGEKI